MTRTVAVVAYEGAEELDFIGPWETLCASAHLRELDGAQAHRVLLVAERADPLRCSHGLTVVPDTTFAELPDPDVVVVPGGHGTERQTTNPAMLQWLAAAARTATWTTSVCTGAFLLHAAGVTAGKRVATHWMAEETLAGLGVEVARGERWVQDGRVVSSQGVSAGIDMALWLVGQLYDIEHARAVRRYLQYDPVPPYAEA